MAIGFLVGHKKVALFNRNGNRSELDISLDIEECDIDRIVRDLSKEGLGFLQSREKSIITFCSSINTDVRRSIVASIASQIGQKTFASISAHNIVLAARYSFPQNDQVCLDVLGDRLRVFVLRRGLATHISDTDCSVLYFVQNDQTSSEHQTGYFDEVIANKIAEEAVQLLVKTCDMVGNGCRDQGIFVFSEYISQNQRLLSKIESMIQTPLVVIPSDYGAMLGAMSIIFANRSSFNYLFRS